MDEINQLKTKIARFCAWRERCIKETEDKLFTLGANAKQTQQLVAWLQKENYLSNIRFATAFTRGKFSNNQWGKLKIKSELLQRNIPDQIISNTLENIDQNEYESVAFSLAKKKWKETKTDDLFLKKQKTAAYLSGKGYESDIAWKAADVASQDFSS